MWKYIPVAMFILLTGCSQGMISQGRSEVDRGNYDAAIEIFYDHIRNDPKSSEAWRELGVAFYKKGDLTKAEDALKQANNIKPDPRANLYLGLIYEKQNNHDKAIAAYGASLNLNPKGEVKELILTHLDRLIIKKVEREVASALENESNIDVGAIPGNSIAVVNFDDSHLPPDLAPISKGMAEFTAIDLAKVKSLRVVDRQKLDMILKELKLSSSEYANPAFAPRMGRLVGSSRIITGSVLALGDEKIRIDGAVVDTRDSSADMTAPTEGDLEAFFRVQKDFVFKVVDQLGVILSVEERDAIEEIPTESFLAFMAFCRGLDYKSRGMNVEAQQEFRQAHQTDRGFTQASVQQQAAARLQAGGGEGETFEEFESSLVSSSDAGSSEEGVDVFQAGALHSHGFIRDPGELDRYGNTPDSPIRTVSEKGFGTVIVRGNLDAEP